MADSGLLVFMLDDETQLDILANRNLGGWEGGFYENIFPEALSKSGNELHYWKCGDSTLEEDFFIRGRRSGTHRNQGYPRSEPIPA